MALPATHIRFAGAVANRYRITDASAYYSGTLYPDSRWVTGLTREQTHGDAVLRPDFVRDDFTLGWQVHLICDRVQRRLHEPLMGDLSALGLEERWTVFTAAKVVQDMRDAALGALAERLPLLERAATPNGEDPDGVAAYLAYVRHAYRSHTAPDWADYEQLWQAVGLDREQIGRIAAQAHHIMDDAVLKGRIQATFDQMVSLSSTDDLF